jgi:hypothetical protein
VVAVAAGEVVDGVVVSRRRRGKGWGRPVGDVVAVRKRDVARAGKD